MDATHQKRGEKKKQKNKFQTHYNTKYIKMTDENVYNIINDFFDLQKAPHRVPEAINQDIRE